MGELNCVDVLLLLGALYSVFTDVKKGKIKNHITLPLMGLGLFFNIYIKGFNGALFSLKGTLVAFFISILLFLVDGFGMGDVKLFMGIGAIRGAGFVLDVLVFSFVFSIIISILWQPKRFIKAISNTWYMIKSYMYGNPQVITKEGSAIVLPYAIPIFCGLIMTYIIGGDWTWSFIR